MGLLHSRHCECLCTALSSYSTTRSSWNGTLKTRLFPIHQARFRQIKWIKNQQQRESHKLGQFHKFKKKGGGKFQSQYLLAPRYYGACIPRSFANKWAREELVHTLVWSSNYSRKNTTNVFFSPKWLFTNIYNWTLHFFFFFFEYACVECKNKCCCNALPGSTRTSRPHLRSSKAENTSSNILPGAANMRHVAPADNRKAKIFKYRHASKMTDCSSVYIKNLP